MPIHMALPTAAVGKDCGNVNDAHPFGDIACLQAHSTQVAVMGGGLPRPPSAERFESAPVRCPNRGLVPLS